jgi:vanadium chloroperoxidase
VFEAAPISSDDQARNAVPVFYWNFVALEMNRLTHSLGGPQSGPTMSSRALGLLHLAIHDAWFGLQASPTFPPYLGVALPVPPTGGGSLGLTAQQVAIGGAATTVLDALYRGAGAGISVAARDQLVSALDRMISGAPFRLNALDPAFAFGQAVAGKILMLLAVQPGQIGAGQGHYEPRADRYYFRDEPVNPVRLPLIDPEHPQLGDKPVRIYHGPFYGTTVATFSVTDEDALILAPPPKDEPSNPAAERAEYRAALREVKRLGGAPNAAGTTRTPNQTVAGYYWAYDGANLIGTPPRLYNQIVRTVAWDRRSLQPDPALQEDEFVRVLALANTAMADAGKFSWREKYRYEFWRPLSGVREHDVRQGPEWDDAAATLSSEQDPSEPTDGLRDGDPFWEALGAPETNTDKISFKPPFPAYPSGHATFGAACFQIVRLFYKERNSLSFGDHDCDEIGFSFVSDELDGYSRDLRQPYIAARPIVDQPGTVRTRMQRTFPGLWHAIFENAISRIFLGVHWRFDAFRAADALTNPTGNNARYKDPCAIDYDLTAGEMVGGVPLGLSIADQIWAANMLPAPGVAESISKSVPVMASVVPPTPQVESSNTNIR